MIDLEKKWQKVAKALVNAENDFKKFQGELVLSRSAELEKLPVHNQHILTLSTMKSDFYTALERLSVYSRRNGGLQFLLMEEETKDLTDSENESLKDEDKETE